MLTDLITILGPTASGKTRLAVRLANDFNGEIISADSRQVYRRMNIGTGKDLEDYKINGSQVEYYLIDIVDPEKEFNLFEFQRKFYQVLDLIKKRKKLPFLVGGTGLYLSSILQNYKLKKTDFSSDRAEELRSLNMEELEKILLSKRSDLHNKTDLVDKERIIKAILISETETEDQPGTPAINSVVIGIKADREITKKRIKERLEKRLSSGMIEEVDDLIKSGVTYEKLDSFGLEYRYISLYLKDELNYNDMVRKLNSAINNFAKRQMTWFRKMEREGVKINWIEATDYLKAGQIVRDKINA
jgi:tRNA dimethylallyltransferase